jgi:pilus assembly protein Flp/PilA
MWTRSLRCLCSFLEEEQGPTAVEYAVLLALIITVCIAAISTIGSNVDETAEVVSLGITNGS